MGVFFGNLELVGPKLIYQGPWLVCGSLEVEFLRVRRTSHIQALTRRTSLSKD